MATLLWSLRICRRNGDFDRRRRAFIGEHSFSKVLAAGRPDEADRTIIREFATKATDKLIQEDFSVPDVTGQRPYRPYYVMKKPEGSSVDFRKIKPVTSDACIACGLCAKVCPTGAIDVKDVPDYGGLL